MSKRLPILSFSIIALLIHTNTVRAGLPVLSSDIDAEQYYTDTERQDGSEAPYYKDAKRGWYWYEKELQKAKEKEEQKPQEKTEKRRIPNLKDYPIEVLWGMHPDDFQPLLIDFQKKAIMSPTQSNVGDYYYMQDIARRKSLAFANVSATVMQNRPDLDLTKDYPNVTPGRNALTRQVRNEVTKGINEARNDFGLIYFYSPACEYCAEESKIISYFERQYRWEIKKIDIAESPGLAQAFDVDVVPHIMLVYDKSLDPITISTGVISLEEMEDKIYRGARLLKGEITPEEYSMYEFQRGGGFDVNAPPSREKQKTNLKGR